MSTLYNQEGNAKMNDIATTHTKK